MFGRGGNDDMLSSMNQPAWRRTIERNKFYVITYGALAVLLLFVWHFISDNDFSFLLVCCAPRCTAHRHARAGSTCCIRSESLRGLGRTSARLTA